MELKTRIDITMQQLHKYVKDWRIAHPSVRDSGEALIGAIAERWPSADPRDILIDAEMNWLEEDDRNITKRAISNLNEWITTKVQGDLFLDWEMECPPKFVMADGSVKPYWEVSPVDQLPMLEALEAAIRFEAEQLEAAAETKRVRRSRVLGSLEKTQRLIEEARRRGIDPATIRYEKKA